MNIDLAKASVSEFLSAIGFDVAFWIIDGSPVLGAQLTMSKDKPTLDLLCGESPKLRRFVMRASGKWMVQS